MFIVSICVTVVMVRYICSVTKRSDISNKKSVYYLGISRYGGGLTFPQMFDQIFTSHSFLPFYQHNRSKTLSSNWRSICGRPSLLCLPSALL